MLTLEQIQKMDKADVAERLARHMGHEPVWIPTRGSSLGHWVIRCFTWSPPDNIAQAFECQDAIPDGWRGRYCVILCVILDPESKEYWQWNRIVATADQRSRACLATFEEAAETEGDKHGKRPNEH